VFCQNTDELGQTAKHGRTRTDRQNTDELGQTKHAHTSDRKVNAHKICV